MTDKVSLIEVDNIYSPTAATNIMANFTAIVDRLNESVSRDGLAPNFMTAELDMNGYDIINAGSLLLADSVTFGGVAYTDIAAGTNVTFVADGDGTATINVSSGTATVADADYGDITVSGSGATWTIDTGVVSLTKLSVGVQSSLALADSSVQPGDTVPATDVSFSGLDVSIVSTNASDAIKEVKTALDSLVLGGVASVTPTTVTVDNGAVISDATHGILYPNADDLEVRTVVLLNSVSGANAMAVTISDDLTLPVQFVIADTQTGTVTFNRETTGTINGTTSEVMTGARKRADLSVVAAGEFNLYGDLDKERSLFAALNANDQQIKAARLIDTAKVVNPLGSTSGAISANYTLGQVVTVTLTGNATSLTIPNPPASGNEGKITFIVNHGSGPFSWVHPSGTIWPSGTPPTLSDGANEISVVRYSTTDGGTVWYGEFIGEDYS